MLLPYLNLIRFSFPFKISNTRSLPLSRSKVCKTSTSMITELVEISSLLPHEIRALINSLWSFESEVWSSFFLKQIFFFLEFINVNDLIRTEIDGTKIFGFVEIKGWFGVTIKMENGRVDWKFATELEINMNHYETILKEICMILEEDKDLEQEDLFHIAINCIDPVNGTTVLRVSCFTKSGTHEDYFKISYLLLLISSFSSPPLCSLLLLLKLLKLIHATTKEETTSMS
ncbi:hypothetical protein MKX01_018344 [Papaver californicum]|nr:hypothetical protein MKX01_018344 [Papaver californicum]